LNAPAPLHRAAAAVALAGTLVVVALSLDARMGVPHALELVAWAGGTALVSVVGTLLALRRVGSRSVAAQLTLVGALPTMGGLLGVWLGARAMVFTSDDLTALVILLVTAGTVSVVTALVLGARAARTGAELLAATRRLADGDALDPLARPGSGELDRLARELERTSSCLAEARERERALERSRRELIAWVSHDLRTPLAGVRAIAEALEDGIAEDRETVERYLATLRTEADQLATLVDDLFELSRAQSGQLIQQFEPVSLHDLVSDAVAGISPVAAAKGVRVEGRVAGPSGDLHGSPVALTRALRNILENAVRHTPADGAVVVEAGVQGDEAFVSVLDCGGGIPDDELPRIFDTGFRGDPARSKGGGAGLGLAIAHEVVRAHRGDIVVRNENGGAEFVVRVPAGPPAPEPTA
jgi:signal transduction histidine kinase